MTAIQANTEFHRFLLRQELVEQAFLGTEITKQENCLEPKISWAKNGYYGIHFREDNFLRVADLAQNLSIFAQTFIHFGYFLKEHKNFLQTKRELKALPVTNLQAKNLRSYIATKCQNQHLNLVSEELSY